MSGCANYNKLCSNASVVAECKTHTMLPQLPTTQQANQMVQDICTSMSMADCDACVAPTGGGYPQCDILTTYAKLCTSMPDMEQCSMYKGMCASTPSFPLCASSMGSEMPPSMIMYFHNSIHEYVLFKNWVPQNEGQYAGAWFAIFFIAIFYQGLSVVRSNCEGYWLLNAAQESKGKFKLFGPQGKLFTHAAICFFFFQNHHHNTKAVFLLISKVIFLAKNLLLMSRECFSRL